MKEYTHQQWLDKLKSRFGENVMDWAAYGLFGTLSKGDIVITENGNRIKVFPMAEKKEN